MRKTLESLAKKATLAVALTTGALGLSQQTQAQIQTQPETLHILGSGIHRSSHYMQDPKKARGLHFVGDLVHDLAHLAAIAPDGSNYNNYNNSGQRASAEFYVFHGFNDVNRNGWADSSRELVGIDKNSFWEDEQTYVGVRVKGLRGNTASYKFISPKGNVVDSGTKTIDYNNGFVQIASFGKGFPNTMKKHGPGIYSMNFYLDNQRIGMKKFVIKSNIQMDLCNYWKDLDGNNSIGRDKEFLGLGKRVFNENESFTPLLYARNKKGETTNIRLFNPEGKEIYSNIKKFTGDSQWVHSKKNVRDLTSVHGAGTYLAAFYVGGDNVGAIPFELRGTQRTVIDDKRYLPEQRERHSPSEQKLIKEYWGIIGQRAKALNKGSGRMVGDPIGYNLSDNEILKLHKVYGNFSEQNIRNFYENGKEDEIIE